jgi:hypothetical protein
MTDILDKIEKHRWGIIVTFFVHIGTLLYLQVETYLTKLPERDFEVMAEVTEYEDYIEINPDNLITEEEFNANLNSDVRNLTRDMNDKRERSSENFSRSSIDSKIEQNARELEQQYFNEFASGRPDQSSSGGPGSNPSNSNTSPSTNSNTLPNNNNSSAANSGGNQIDGETMKSYDLANRTPHNNNDWHIRNPGYRCGSGSNGKVVIAIRVNQNGDVISARYVPEKSSSANSCMIEQAEKYAKMSRFNYSSTAPKTQEGFIIYTFVSRK